MKKTKTNLFFRNIKFRERMLLIYIIGGIIPFLFVMLYINQHRLYSYLNTASNLETLMNQGGTQGMDALEQVLNAKVVKYTILIF